MAQSLTPHLLSPPQVYLRYHKLTLGGKKADLVERVRAHAAGGAS
jgi:hypothetical protein